MAVSRGRGTTLKYVILVVFLRNFWHTRTQEKQDKKRREHDENNANFSGHQLETWKMHCKKNMLNTSDFYETALRFETSYDGLFFSFAHLSFSRKSAKYLRAWQTEMEVSGGAATCVINHKEFISHSYAFNSDWPTLLLPSRSLALALSLSPSRSVRNKQQLGTHLMSSMGCGGGHYIHYIRYWHMCHAVSTLLYTLFIF